MVRPRDGVVVLGEGAGALLLLLQLPLPGGNRVLGLAAASK